MSSHYRKSRSGIFPFAVGIALLFECSACNAAEHQDYLFPALFIGSGYDPKFRHTGLEVGVGIGGEIEETSTSLVVYPIQAMLGCKVKPDEDTSAFERKHPCFDLLMLLPSGSDSDPDGSSTSINTSFKAEYTPSVELIQKVWRVFSVGAGYRVGDSPGPYGALLLGKSGHGYFEVRGGEHYVGVSFGGYFSEL